MKKLILLLLLSYSGMVIAAITPNGWLPTTCNASHAEGDFLYGKRHGQWTQWSLSLIGRRCPSLVSDIKNESKVSQGNYTNGERDGKWTTWHENGRISSEENYTNGERDGKQTWWHSNGQLWFEGNYINGKQDGKWTDWHANGQIREEGNSSSTVVTVERDLTSGASLTASYATTGNALTPASPVSF